MKTKIYLYLVLIMSVLITSCTKDQISINPLSNITTETIDIIGFDKLDIIGPFEVLVSISDSKESILVEANENLQEHIKVSKSGNKLVVLFDSDVSLSGETTLRINISMKNVTEIIGMGAVVINFENELITNNLNVQLDGASTLAGALNIETLTVGLIGASVLNLTGHADTFKLTGIGASYIQGYDFNCDYLDATLEGASVLYMTINTQIDLQASGASFIYYKGEAVINSLNLSGASIITKVD